MKLDIKYVIFILLCLLISLFFYQTVEARVVDWLLGGTKTVVVVNPPPRTLDSEIDRLSIKYGVASSTARSIIKCESSMYGEAINRNRLPDGTVWSSDFGPFQVNDYFHEDTMTKLGLDIHNQFDSLEYGFMLLSSQGVGPWKASAKCHGFY
jgi:hypothetical protein